MDNLVYQVFQSAWNVAGIFGLAIIAAVIAAYWAFNNFSTMWLDTKYAGRLEQHKHVQQRELEALKFRINGLIDKTIKIYFIKYEHLPKLWFQIDLAYRSARAMEAGIFLVTPNTMNPERLDLFLEGTALTDLERCNVTDAIDKDRAHTETLRFNIFNAAQAEHSKLFKSHSKYSIFLVNN